MSKKVIIVGTGNAAMCAALSALEQGATVTMLEKSGHDLAGGNTKYTAGAMRFSYDSKADLLPLIKNHADPKLANADFGSYTQQQFSNDLLGFNESRELSPEQTTLISESGETMTWLASHGVKFEPIYSRQSFVKDGKYIFWGGLTLAAENEGVGLHEMQLAAVKKLGATVVYNCAVTGLLMESNAVAGVEITHQKNPANEVSHQSPTEIIEAEAVILASGGFEANQALRMKYIGNHWDAAKVRGTPHNTGDGMSIALAAGAAEYGKMDGCHATPMDLHMPDFGDLNLDPKQRKNHRKICYFLGVMLNAKGQRFVDEGKHFRNYTYAQFGRAILEQPKQFAWQVFDQKTFDLLYEEYHFHGASFIQADTLEQLVTKMEGIDASAALQTLTEFNEAVNVATPFDPTILDGKATQGLILNKSNWAQKIDQGPYRAYPVTGGITFTYGGLKINGQGQVLTDNGTTIDCLYACGELVGGVFYGGYPGGSGLTSGAVFGRIAGRHAGAW